MSKAVRGINALVISTIILTFPSFELRAADIPVRPQVKATAPAVAPLTWSGCYLGLHGGYGWGDADDVQPVGVPRNLSPDGYFAGGQIGCNWQYQPNWVFGVEADIAGANISEQTQFTGGVAPNITHRIKSLATIRGRAGWANGQHLWYLTGGWGWARADRNTTFMSGPAFSQRVGTTHDGWVLGAGYERMIDQNWTVKLEYLYYDLGRETYNFSAFGQPSIDLTLHTVKFGVNYKF